MRDEKGMKGRALDRKKKIYTGPLLITAGIASVVLFFQGNGDLLLKLKTEAAVACYQEILEWYLPGLAYEAADGDDDGLTGWLLAHIFPLGEEQWFGEEYQTQFESELSYEAILAREAADENYVDENGNVVETGGGPADYGVMSGETDKTGAGAAAGIVAENSAADSETAKNGAVPDSSGTAEGEMTASDPPASDSQGQPVAGNDGERGQTEGSAAAQGAGAALPVTATGKAVTYPREKLNDFDYLTQNFYQIDNTTTINGSQLNADALLGKDVRLSHDASAPQILIYHTHSQEGYADSVAGDASTTVVGVGDYLTKILTEQYGMNVIHHKGEYDVGDRDHAYSRAGPALEKLLAENPGIEVVIDLHRDGVREDTRLVTEVNGKQTAKIMFFNGLSRTTRTGDIEYLANPYIADNLAVSFQMQLKAAEYYPGFTRRIYLKGYRYNMHYCPKTLLIEVGAQTNTVQEAMNAMEPLADILNKVLTGPQ